MKRIVWFAAVCFAVSGANGFVYAQDLSETVADLNERVQMLEQQNAELRRGLADARPESDESQEFQYASHGNEQAFIESIVEQRFAELEAQRMAAEGEK